MNTIASVLTYCTQELERVGVDNARFEARLLLCHVLHVETQVLIGYPEREICDADFQKIETLLARRVLREPMSHILGEREFWSLSFKVTSDTLTPRPDSETLIEAVLDQFKDRATALRVLDLGVGTGCLLLATLSEYHNASGLGIDISEGALSVAKENARNLGLAERSEFRIGNWGEGIEETFDLILSNPPYIAIAEKEDLAPEVKDFEPETALFAGLDGLDDYRKLADMLAGLLKPAGRAVIEVGIDQAEPVVKLMEKGGLELLAGPKDLGGIVRCLVLRKKP